MATNGSGILSFQDPSESSEATIGPGQRYASVQAAVTAGEHTLIIGGQNIAVNADVSFNANEGYSIIIPTGNSLVLTNARLLSGSKVIIKGDDSIGSAASTPTQLTINVTSALAGAIFTTNDLSFENLSVAISSNQDGQLLNADTCRVLWEKVTWTVTGTGVTAALMQFGDNSSISNSTITANNTANFYLGRCNGDFSMSNINITAATNMVDFYLQGTGSAIVQNCNFNTVNIGSDLDATSWDTCTFTSSTHGGAPGSTAIRGDNKFIFCRFVTPAAQLVFSTGNDNIRILQSDISDNDAMTIVSNNNIIDGCTINLPDVAFGSLNVVGANNTISSCKHGAAFRIDVLNGATNTKIIGNDFTTALVDSGTNTYNAGNSTS